MRIDALSRTRHLVINLVHRYHARHLTVAPSALLHTTEGGSLRRVPSVTAMLRLLKTLRLQKTVRQRAKAIALDYHLV